MGCFMRLGTRYGFARDRLWIFGYNENNGLVSGWGHVIGSPTKPVELGINWHNSAKGGTVTIIIEETYRSQTWLCICAIEHFFAPILAR